MSSDAKHPSKEDVEALDAVAQAYILSGRALIMWRRGIKKKTGEEVVNLCAPSQQYRGLQKRDKLEKMMRASEAYETVWD